MTHYEQTNTAVVRSLYEDVLNCNRVDLLSTLVAQDVLLHPGGEKGFDAYKAVIDRVQAAFSDCHFSVEDCIANGDRVAVRWTMDAVHSGPLAGLPATGKCVKQHANVIFRLERDKIAEVWTQMDQIGMLRQLGVDPLAGVARQSLQAGARQ
ncbi:MAG TPA: ester cyclase [Bryobacteraceae bacterium]|nr:ester cyclase [Bryobacteraceae bacterium]